MRSLAYSVVRVLRLRARLGALVMTGAVLAPTSLAAARPVPAQAEPPPADSWDALIQSGRREQGIDALIVREQRARLRAQQEENALAAAISLLEEQAESRKRALREAFEQRRERGVRWIVYGSSGLGVSGDKVGAELSAAGGLRAPLSPHWDLQARLWLGTIVGTEGTEYRYDYESGHLAASTVKTGAALIHTGADLTFRAHGSGVSGHFGYFGFGFSLGGIFTPIPSIRYDPPLYRMQGPELLEKRNTWRNSAFGGTVLEAGAVFGKRESWDMGVRCNFGGGSQFATTLSLVVGYSPSRK